MDPSTRIQLLRQLEAIKVFEQKNVPSRSAYAGWWLELLLGAWFLGWSVVRPAGPVPEWTRAVLFLMGLALFCQGSWLLFRHHLDKRYRLLLEAILSIPNTIDTPEPLKGTERTPRPRVRRTRKR